MAESRKKDIHPEPHHRAEQENTKSGCELKELEKVAVEGNLTLFQNFLTFSS